MLNLGAAEAPAQVARDPMEPQSETAIAPGASSGYLMIELVQRLDQ